MDALRTAVVLVLLLALGYGVWVVLNHDSGVEDPPAFDWDETADGGVSGFGNGPFVPPAGETGGGDFAFGGPAPTTDGGADSGSPIAASGYGPAAGSPATAAPSNDDSSLPPPPPGFAEASGDGAGSYGADTGADTDVAPASDTDYAATGPADAASRYGAEPSDTASAPANGSRYGADTVAEPPAPTETAEADVPAASTPIGTSESSASLAVKTIEETIAEAKQLIADNEHYEALYLLSQRYGDPTIEGATLKEMLTLLDRLAGKVIYSTEHLLEESRIVRRGEDLFMIAKEMNVPHELLKNINAIGNPSVITPGTELKVVRGPFRADVDLTRNELTLFLGPLYAGRFPVSVGAEPSPAPGDYQVKTKEPGKAYFGSNGASFPADHPANPYGRFWMDLGNQLCIHGTPTSGENKGMGCVSLSPLDAADVYGILSAGSKVTIRR